MVTHFDSLFDLMDSFPNEQACIDHLRTIRWRDGEFCPYCNHNKINHYSDGKTFKCASCRQRFSIKVGTIFENTKLPLRKWFMAVWLVSNHPKGIASTTLGKDLKVTQKTAWFVLHRLGYAAQTKSFNEPLEGENESDTTFVGDKKKNKRAKDCKGGTQGGAGKAVVLGIIERDGELRAEHVDDHKAKTLQGKIRKSVKEGSTVLTDEDKAFVGLDKDCNHLSVNHSAGEYVRLGELVHTNSIESVWALLKRQIIGVHHWVSPKHLQRYVDEMTWRFTHRELKVSTRMNGLFACVEGCLRYRELIA